MANTTSSYGDKNDENNSESRPRNDSSLAVTPFCNKMFNFSSSDFLNSPFNKSANTISNKQYSNIKHSSTPSKGHPLRESVDYNKSFHLSEILSTPQRDMLADITLPTSHSRKSSKLSNLRSADDGKENNADFIPEIRSDEYEMYKSGLSPFFKALDSTRKRRQDSLSSTPFKSEQKDNDYVSKILMEFKTPNSLRKKLDSYETYDMSHNFEDDLNFFNTSKSSINHSFPRSEFETSTGSKTSIGIHDHLEHKMPPPKAYGAEVQYQVVQQQQQQQELLAHEIPAAQQGFMPFPPPVPPPMTHISQQFSQFVPAMPMRTMPQEFIPYPPPSPLLHDQMYHMMPHPPPMLDDFTARMNSAAISTPLRSRSPGKDSPSTILASSTKKIQNREYQQQQTSYMTSPTPENKHSRNVVGSAPAMGTFNKKKKPKFEFSKVIKPTKKANNLQFVFADFNSFAPAPPKKKRQAKPRMNGNIVAENKENIPPTFMAQLPVSRQNSGLSEIKPNQLNAQAKNPIKLNPAEVMARAKTLLKTSSTVDFRSSS